MIRDFSKEDLAPAESNDTEWTLGAGALLTLGGGLLLLCAVCFGLGYVVGHRSSQQQDAAAASASPQTSSKRPFAPVVSGSKPGAAGQAPARTLAQAATDNGSQGEANVTPAARADSTTTGSSQAGVKPAMESQVRPALAAQSGSGQPATALQVQPAMTQVQGWMVQIAAVTHPEDAQVLVDALRKRGYSVMARREVSDNLIHVQTGPFVNRNDANAMRQKLLNDGYNAVVQ